MKPRQIDLTATVNDDALWTFDNLTVNSIDYGAASTATMTMKQVKDPTTSDTIAGVVDPADANKFAFTWAAANNTYQGEWYYEIQVTDGVTAKVNTHVKGSLKVYPEV